jgi:DNA-directed RNA polymerase subunit RPC12/RpoP|tara:strand:- start:2170 stop:2349 length:180 start_codon:yes stop_codon:yes gene_type:complete
MVYNCIICDSQEFGYGNNAMPIKDGICCDACNLKVIIARIKQIKEGKAKTSNQTPTKNK